MIRRGLCQSHYGEFRTAKSQVDDSELEMWDACLVAKGLILPDARKAANPYINTLAELRANRSVLTATDFEDAEQESSDAARRVQVQQGQRQVAEGKTDYESKKPTRKKRSG